MYVGLKFKTTEMLKKRIISRVEKRISMGAIEEVKSLLKKGYDRNDPGLKTIGYQQMIDYIDGTISLDDAKTDWIYKEIQYAKRQLTFMKKDLNIVWRDVV